MVRLLHRFRPHAIEKTEYKNDGVKILAATPWKEDEQGNHIGKFKLLIEKNSEKKPVFTVFRTRDKGGDKTDMTFRLATGKVEVK